MSVILLCFVVSTWKTGKSHGGNECFCLLIIRDTYILYNIQFSFCAPLFQTEMMIPAMSDIHGESCIMMMNHNERPGECPRL